MSLTLEEYNRRKWGRFPKLRLVIDNEKYIDHTTIATVEWFRIGEKLLKDKNVRIRSHRGVTNN